MIAKLYFSYSQWLHEKYSTRTRGKTQRYTGRKLVCALITIQKEKGVG